VDAEESGVSHMASDAVEAEKKVDVVLAPLDLSDNSRSLLLPTDAVAARAAAATPVVLFQRRIRNSEMRCCCCEFISAL